MHTRVESPRICLRLGFVLGDLLAVCILPLNMGVYLYVRTRVSRRVLFGDIGVFQVVGTENLVALRGCESLSQRDNFYRVVGRQQFMTRGARLAGDRKMGHLLNGNVGFSVCRYNGYIVAQVRLSLKGCRYRT